MLSVPGHRLSTAEVDCTQVSHAQIADPAVVEDLISNRQNKKRG